MGYRVIACRVDDVVLHDYGDKVVLFQGVGSMPGVHRAVSIDPKKLHRKLGKFLKRKKHAR